MKKFAKLVVTLIVLLACTQLAQAQLADVPTPERQAERMTKVMSRRLELSPKQTRKVLDLNLRLAQKQSDLLHNEEIDFFDRLEKLKAITKTRADDLKTILNDEQYQLYYELNHRTRKDSAIAK